MTPSALTPAARRADRQPSPAPSSSSAARPSGPARPSGHRSSVRRPPAPRSPRRVSGPAGGIVGPRRVSGPRQAPAMVAPRPLAARAGAFVRALPDHALLDRIIRGRVWIPLLGVLLVGIVAMQLEVLKLNAGIGRSLQSATALQGQNQLLRVSVARLGDDQRIEALAQRMGMAMPAPQEQRFLAAGGVTVQRAIRAIRPRNSTSFATTLSAEQASIAAAAAAATAASNPPSTTASATAAGTTVATAGAAAPPVAATPVAGPTSTSGG